MKNLLAKGLLVIIEAGIEVVAEQIKKALHSPYTSAS